MSRNWKQINEEFAKLGISNNAYTSNTEVVYHSTCPKENLEKTINLMLDMFFNSTFPKDEMEKERNVIIEEKKMYDDDPKSAFYSAVSEKMFNWNVGHDTIGTFDTIKSISRKQMIKYLDAKTNLDNFIFICVGDVKSEDLIRYIEKNIPENHKYLKKGNGLHKIDTNQIWRKEVLDNPSSIYVIERENIAQSNVCMMFDALPEDHPMRYAEAILFNAVGGGMFSKLFSRIREELGLCYSCGMYALPVSYPDAKVGNLYGFVSLENVDKFILESEKVLKDVMVNGLDEDAFECAKTDYLADVLRQIETSEGKAKFITKRVLIHKRVAIEDTISKLKKVTRDDCNELAKQSFSKQYHWAVMKPKEK
jgi:predicted Zn-dependent peptidase